MLSGLIAALVTGTLGQLAPIVGIVNGILFESGGSPITILQNFLF